MKGPRVLLDNVSLRNWPAAQTPGFVRIRLSSADLPSVGSQIRAFARLMSSGPLASPGAFDFQRHAFYARIGAVGCAYRTSRKAGATPDAHGGTLAIRIAGVRQEVAARIRTAIPGTRGAVADALITRVPRKTIAALRDSGLAYLLAISELHIELVVATTFFGLRAMLALSERLACDIP